MPPYNDVSVFQELLANSRRILALCGAGLSASSGLPTFRGAGGFWRNYDATELATPEAFDENPFLVWNFYAYRRHLALKAFPNAAHYSLAELAKRKPEFLCLTQNVDGLSQRAGHPAQQLKSLHGSLFDIKCDNAMCDWVDMNNLKDPLCDELALAAVDIVPGQLHPLLDASKELPPVGREQLPRCGKCSDGIQRPGVVWFGEALDKQMLRQVDRWVCEDQIDLMLVIGTSAVVHPAASYIAQARQQGAIVCVVNIEAEKPEELRKLEKRDFAFGGDAAEILPILLEPVIGKHAGNGKFESSGS